MKNNYYQIALKLIQAGVTGKARLRLLVTGRSMLPFLRPGDTVIVDPVEPDSLRQGDLIVVRRGETMANLVTHRLVALGNGVWYTKGDNAGHLDPPVYAEAIVGRVVALERKGTRVNLQNFRWSITNRLLGWLAPLEVRLHQAGRSIKKIFYEMRIEK